MGLGATLPFGGDPRHPVIVNPADSGYGNAAYASSFQDMVTQIASNKNAATAQAQATAQADAQGKKVQGALIGAGLAFIVLKYIL